MSGECDECGWHCLDCRCELKQFFNKTLRDHIDGCIRGLDGNMMCHYYNEKYNTKEFNAGCVYAFALAIGALEACLRLDKRRNE